MDNIPECFFSTPMSALTFAGNLISSIKEKVNASKEDVSEKNT
jgi:hypothetical protein